MEQSEQQIIAEIHNTFYTEVDRLLEEANKLDALKSELQIAVDKRKRLLKLGFENSREVKETTEKVFKLSNLKEESKDLVNFVKYCDVKYPTYKVITEDAIKIICKKYNLIYGLVQDFTGVVPEKNLIQIESLKAVSETGNEINSYGIFKNKLISVGKSDLLIVAPQVDFNLKDKQILDFEVKPRPVISKINVSPVKSVKDPIVLQKMTAYFRRKGYQKIQKKNYFIIVTAWGLEAEDKAVINKTYN